MRKLRTTAVTTLALAVGIGVGWYAKTLAQGNSGAGVATVYSREKLNAAWVQADAGRGGMVFWSRSSDKGKFDVHTNTRESVRNACPAAGCQHKDVTDLVYVASGAADLTIGGTAKASAPDKFGGQWVQGGESHRIRAGDIFIMPPDTVHWYKNVEPPFRYLVVPIP